MRLKSLQLYTEDPAEEFAVSGHRACQGCAEILALRLALKSFRQRYYPLHGNRVHGDYLHPSSHHGMETSLDTCGV